MTLPRAIALLLVSSTLAAAACSKPKPVEVTPRSAQLASIGPEGVTLSIVLDIHNPNSFAISASAVTATLELENGAELGRGSALPAFTIPAEGDAALMAQLGMRWTNLALVTPYALNGKAMPYRIRGTARVGGEHLNVELPFTISGQLTPEQALQAGLRGASSLIPTLR
jgi:LEA14-like dessication related protein